jgi:tetratricopeptide (TPR) repeat protein
MSTLAKTTALLICLVIAACRQDPTLAALEHLKNADRYAARRNYRAAAVEYRNAIKQNPQLIEARIKLAEAALQLGDLATALGEYVRAADLAPQDAGIQTKAAEMLLVEGRFVDAATRAEKALAVDPLNVEAQIVRANGLAGVNKLDSAMEQLQETIKIAPERTSLYTNLGALQLAQGDQIGAEATFQKGASVNPGSVDARLALANFYTAAGRPQHAEEQLAEALRLDDAHILANRAMATLRIAQGRTADAEPYLRKAAAASADDADKLTLVDHLFGTQRIEEGESILRSIAASNSPGANGARVRLANLALRQSKPAEATRHVDEVLKSDPAATDALLLKAQLQANEGKLDEALATLRAASTTSGNDARVPLALGRLYVARKQPAEAITAFTAAMKFDAELTDAAIGLARLHLSAGRGDLALELVDHVLRREPKHGDALLLRGRALLARKDIATAETALTAVAASAPESVAVQIELGRVQFAKGDRAGARATFETVLRADSRNFDALTGLTRLDLLEKNGPQARARVEQALAQRPGDGQLLLLAAATYAELRDFSAAEATLRQAIERDPSNMQAYVALARLFNSQGRLPEATAEYAKVAASQPRSVAIQTTYAQLLQMQRRTSEAKEVYQRIVDMDSHAALASNNLAWIILEEGGNLDIALQLAKNAKASLPDNAAVNDTLGWLYYKRNLATMAVPPLELAVEKDPGVATYHYHLGLAYAAADLTDRARAAFNKALSLKPSAAEAKSIEQALNQLR